MTAMAAPVYLGQAIQASTLPDRDEALQAFATLFGAHQSIEAVYT